MVELMLQEHDLGAFDENIINAERVAGRSMSMERSSVYASFIELKAKQG